MPFQDDDRLLLAVSGGGDSMGMLSLFLSALPRPDLDLGLVHVEHGIRGEEGKGDAARVRDAAARLGLPYRECRVLETPPGGKSQEEWAREVRYRALEEIREAEGWTWVATAHTQDDQAETVLMRVTRGAGLSGLSGIQVMNGRILRPVLSLRGAELREAARECGVRWLEDRSNRDMRFTRNRIRARVLPILEQEFPGTVKHLAAIAEEAAAMVPAELENVAVCDGDTVYYALEILRGLGRQRAALVLREGLRAARGHLRRIERTHYEAVWELTQSAPGAFVHLPGGWEAVREKRGIRLRPRLEIGGRR